MTTENAAEEALTKREGIQQGGAEGSAALVVEFTVDELVQLEAIMASFLEKGASGPAPELAVFMGVLGAGKTTLRRQQCSSGYVQVDFGEVLAAVTRALGSRTHPRLPTYATIVSETVLSRAIAGRKNIAIEVIGGGPDLLAPVLEKMKELGYEVSLRYVELDPAEGYRLHVKAVQEDEEYMSAFHTEGATLGFFYRYFGLNTERLDEYEEAKEL
jgi:hypothetical protein